MTLVASSMKLIFSTLLTERVESEDYKRNKSLLDDWDRTADVRFQWTEQVALQQRIRTSEEELEQLKEKYRSLSVGLGQLERMQVQCREQWAACDRKANHQGRFLRMGSVRPPRQRRKTYSGTQSTRPARAHDHERAFRVHQRRRHPSAARRSS